MMFWFIPSRVMRPWLGRSRSMIRKMHAEIIKEKRILTISIEDFDSFRLMPIIKLLTAQSANRTQMIASGTVACLVAFRVVTTSIMALIAGIIWLDEVKFAGF